MTDVDTGKAATGDAVLDRMLQGGIPRNRTVLVRGGPGTGKTTFGMQFLQEGLENGERCLFVSTEQTQSELRDSFAEFEFDLDHEELAVTTLHAVPDDGDGSGRRLKLRTLEGNSTIDERDVPLTEQNVARHFQAAAGCDRLVFDSISALQVLGDNRELFRRELLELIQLFTKDLGATALFTAEDIDDRVLDFTTHGVIELRRERVNGDPHRFLEITKMRGVDHDTRTVEAEIESGGVRCAPSRRSQPPELKTHKHTSIGIDGLDSLCGGGLATGTGVLFEHDGHANMTALFGAMMHAALDKGYSIVLVPTIRMRPDSVRTILEGHDQSLDSLLDDDRLFVIDMIGAWDETEDNVFGARESATGVRSILDAIAERAGDTPRFSLINADAMVNTLGTDDARAVRYAQEAHWLRSDDLLVHVHNPNVTGDRITGFYTNAAEQVLRTWITDNGLQYVSLKKSPCGFVGTTSLVEYTTEHPFLRVQDPPEERENPYAE
ncbi:AAA family ATPase [Natronomonas sp. CBA1123]|jgi:KaiC/GvpD/RAD55 family RecA-like ATPase|uniref:RAD55 family ATPase n=1 Tax=Natronomonas sp. CBA1123 TaxID=2668070 RepID=UPI0012EA6A6F|nr:ATPase domain-containing protein [Natronomonas sp. CBA1123]MUV87237.1 AAA family ATPase [Natronomonas sp. CBA1123]